MKITEISLFKTPISFAGTNYQLSGGRAYTELDSTLVLIETDVGISGWGEICPWGRDYLPEFAEGARAALKVIKPGLLGLDPSNPVAINTAMDRLLMGHGYAKAAVDMACWDILGKAAGQPVYALLGGRQSDAIPMLSSLYNGPVDDMLSRIERARSAGIKSFSAKASGNVAADIVTFQAITDARRPDETFIIDANGGWSVSAALQVLGSIDGRGLFFEQPCPTLSECLRVKQRMISPFILDESAITAEDLVQILRQDAADALHFKISRVGGITKARMFRDFCAIAGLSGFWEASGGSAVADAAAAHVAVSAPAGTPHKFWSCQEFNAEDFCAGGPTFTNGSMRPPDRPGLGVEVDMTALGSPIV